MAGSNQVSVGTTPTLLASAPSPIVPGPIGWFYLSNGGTATVYLGGGTAVTSSNGLSLGTSATINGWLFPSDQLFGVSGGGSSTISVLTMGV